MKFLIPILFLITGSVFASGKHHSHESTSPPEITTTNSLSLPIQSTYGLLALSANIPFDWGVPDKIQVGATMAFTEGGNQSFSVGAATRVGGILVHGKFVGLIDGPDNEDDYAVVVGGVIRF